MGTDRVIVMNLPEEPSHRLRVGSPLVPSLVGGAQAMMQELPEGLIEWSELVWEPLEE